MLVNLHQIRAKELPLDLCVELLKRIAQLRKFGIALRPIEEADLAFDLERCTPFLVAFTLSFRHAYYGSKPSPILARWAGNLSRSP